MKTIPTILSLLVFAFCQLPIIPVFAERPEDLNLVRNEFYLKLAELEKNEPLQELNTKYRGYLEKQKTGYQKAGNLDGILAVEKEMRGFVGDPQMALSLFPDLSRMQSIYRKQRKKLESALNEKKLALIQWSAEQAKELSVKWTREGRIEDAKQALEDSKSIAAMVNAIPKSMTEEVADKEESSAASPTSRDDSLAAATKEKPFVNSLGMKFVPVPITGGPTVGQTVLFSAWETRVRDYEEFTKDTGTDWPNAGFPQKDDHPAVNASWKNAVAFCEWLTEEERKKRRIGKDQRYRLPTDYEWSCAVGIGNEEDSNLLPSAKNEKLSEVFPWGRDWPPPEGAGNYYGEETKKNPVPDFYAKPIDGYEDSFDRTAPVGSFEPNDYGLYDLGGNVYEWCEDWYSSEQKERVLRGSSWRRNIRGNLLSSHRTYAEPDYWSNNLGFRYVLAGEK